MVNETLTAPVKKMHLDRLEIINEEFHSEAIVGIELDKLLANGWRHFGALFFRYNLNFYRGEIVRVIPLRIRLSDFSVS
ncbi:MAG: hypothetical protein ACRD6X_08460, partial [Pyrinomonadaceae bacterium]